MDRLVDVLVGFEEEFDNQKKYPVKKSPLGAIRVRYDSRSDRAGRFPWIAIVEAKNPRHWSQLLQPFSKWIGIGVEFELPAPISPYGRCRAGSGMDGEVGGELEAGRSRYAMTCSHVLSNNCMSRIFSENEQLWSGHHPDAALVASKNPCFQTPTEQYHNCEPMSDDEVLALAATRGDRLRFSCGANRMRALVLARCSAWLSGSTIYRFPHVALLADLTTASFFRKIIGRAVFSRPGDSGRWVVGDISGRWLGMLVGGDESSGTSFVASGGALFDFFRILLLRRQGTETRWARAKTIA